MTPSEIAKNAYTAIFASFDPQMAEQPLASDYLQHNVAVPTGAAPVLGFIHFLADSGINVITHRVIAEGDLVILHNTYDNAALLGSEQLVAFDVFRVADGQVVEHWDIISEIPTEMAHDNGKF